MEKELPPITLNPVKSSNASAAGFCKETGRLAVQFSTGAIYHYSGLSEDDYNGLMKADSFGKHLNANIKGAFSFSKQ